MISAGNSVLFNGSNQYLSIASNSAFNFGTGNYTVEGWFYWTSVPANARPFTNGQSAGSFQFYWDGGTYTSNKLTISNRVANQLQVSFLPVVNTWYHIAAVRNSGTVSIYVNGTSLGSIADSNNYSTSAVFNIGGDVGNGGTWFFPGYISNVRAVNGTAVYTASFTPPTAPLSAIANTQLLTCQSATIIDNSSNNFTITNNGSATVSATVPFTASISPAPSGVRFLNRSNVAIVSGTQNAIFGYGYNAGYLSMTNLVNNTGVVAGDVAGVGTTRYGLAAAGYGGDKAIFGYGYGYDVGNQLLSITNKVSNTGIVAADTTGIGTVRQELAAAGYGVDKAIFGYGWNGVNSYRSMTNLVSNTGVVATDTTGVGTARYGPAAAGYGTDKAIFGYGNQYGSGLSITNLVNNTGVVANDTTGVGTGRHSLAAASYGTDKAVFGYGYNNSYYSMTNLVSNTGVVSTDTTGVGTSRGYLSAASYGSDKSIFGYGGSRAATSYYSITNKVSNTGVVATDTTGVGTSRSDLAAAGYSVTTTPATSNFKVSKIYADPILITSGLILRIDAGNLSSYAGSGTNWLDLSGNGYTGSLVNGPTFTSSFNGSIVFDGSNDQVRFGGVTSALSTSLTYNIWFNPSVIDTSRTLFWDDDYQGGGDSWVQITSGGAIQSQRDADGFGVLTSSTTISANNWYNFAMVANGASGKTFYLNGQNVGSNNVAISTRSGRSYITLGASFDGTNSIANGTFNGKIATFLVYNRALSASEVLQNYDATRTRFGL